MFVGLYSLFSLSIFEVVRHIWWCSPEGLPRIEDFVAGRSLLPGLVFMKGCLLGLLDWGLGEVDSRWLDWLTVGLSDWRGSVVVIGSIGLSVLNDWSSIGLDYRVTLIIVGGSQGGGLVLVTGFGKDYIGTVLGLLENLMFAVIEFDNNECAV